MSSLAVSPAATLLITFIPRFLENTSLNFKYSNFGNSEMSQLESARGKKINKQNKTPSSAYLLIGPALHSPHASESGCKGVISKGLNTFPQKRLHFK